MKQVIINTKFESAIKANFPISSKWLHPGGDTVFEIIRHERMDCTPYWYKDSNYEFKCPVVIVRNTATIAWSSTGDTEQKEEMLNLSALAMLVGDNDRVIDYII